MFTFGEKFLSRPFTQLFVQALVLPLHFVHALVEVEPDPGLGPGHVELELAAVVNERARGVQREAAQDLTTN